MNKAKLVLGSLFILLLITILFSAVQNNNNLIIYFCDVGQGDAIYVRFPNGSDMLVDGGPGNKVLDCLGKAMPFYDRQINVVVLTHPEQDHLGGLIRVIERYTVEYFVTSPVGNNTQSYVKLKKAITEKGIAVKNLYAGSQIEFDNVVYTLFWPEKQWLASNINLGSQTNVLGVSNPSSNLNDYSLMGILDYKDFEVVLTGDGDIRIDDKILSHNLIANDINDIEVLKVPHHGSKTGMSQEFLNRIHPKLAVIMVGKNSYGHPTAEILQRLEKIGSQVKRTDIDGTIKIQSDGVSWTVDN